MTFSFEVKQELASQKLNKACCVISELNALTQFGSSMTLLGGGRIKMIYRTQNAIVAKRIFILLKQKLEIAAAPRLMKYARFGGQRVYTLTLTESDSRKLLLDLHILRTNPGGDFFKGIPRRALTKKCCQRAFLRGAFLSAGSISTQKKGYHLELSSSIPARIEAVQKVFTKCGIQTKILLRRGITVLYVKDSEQISAVLALIGANQALMRLENIRAQRSLRESVTRVTNCDNNNLEKQLAASQRQISAITNISLHQGLSSLPKSLQEIARLRLSNPDASMEQISQMISPPIGKSGVNHKMRRIVNIAATIIRTEGNEL